MAVHIVGLGFSCTSYFKVIIIIIIISNLYSAYYKKKNIGATIKKLTIKNYYKPNNWAKRDKLD